jgi:hypothetical protein
MGHEQPHLSVSFGDLFRDSPDCLRIMSSLSPMPLHGGNAAIPGPMAFAQTKTHSVGQDQAPPATAGRLQRRGGKSQPVPDTAPPHPAGSRLSARQRHDRALVGRRVVPDATVLWPVRTQIDSRVRRILPALASLRAAQRVRTHAARRRCPRDASREGSRIPENVVPAGRGTPARRPPAACVRTPTGSARTQLHESPKDGRPVRTRRSLAKPRRVRIGELAGDRSARCECNRARADPRFFGAQPFSCA